MFDAGRDGLQTQRLRLRRYQLADLPDLVRLNADPAVMRFLGGVASPAQTEAMLHERLLAYYDLWPGMGVWATLERESGAHIGFHLLNHVRGDETQIQVGYRLFPEYWGKGYATEMNRALLLYGFSELRLAVITANAAPENWASRRVLEKSGLRYVGMRHFSHPAYAAHPDCCQFERTREEWLAEQVPNR